QFAFSSLVQFCLLLSSLFSLFFFNDTATTEIYTLSLHDALPISRNASTGLAGPRRVSFSRIHEPLEVPDLLALQTESFDWLLGNEKWQARVEAARQAGRKDVPTQSGLEEIFEEISPIEDFSGTK